MVRNFFALCGLLCSGALVTNRLRLRWALLLVVPRSQICGMWLRGTPDGLIARCLSNLLVVPQTPRTVGVYLCVIVLNELLFLGWGNRDDFGALALPKSTCFPSNPFHKCGGSFLLWCVISSLGVVFLFGGTRDKSPALLKEGVDDEQCESDGAVCHCERTSSICVYRAPRNCKILWVMLAQSRTRETWQSSK